MGMVRAVVTKPGAPGNLAIGEIEGPVPHENEALVTVQATSLNLGEVRMAQQAPEGQPFGWDMTGVVEQPAADGSGPKLGTRVVGLVRTGAWAELIAVPTNALAEVPTVVTPAQAAALPVAGLTALHAVEKGTGLLGRRALITGASGGVGHFACQLAGLSGASVVGLLRDPAKAETVEATGALAVVGEGAASAAEHAPYKLIVDGVGGPILAEVLKLLDRDAVCVAYGATAGADLTLNLWSLTGGGRSTLYGMAVFRELERESAAIGLSRLVQLVAHGHLQPHISLQGDWTEIGRVAERLLARQVPGKAVIHLSD